MVANKKKYDEILFRSTIPLQVSLEVKPYTRFGYRYLVEAVDGRLVAVISAQ